jgi:signal transduction histidine kinase
MWRQWSPYPTTLFATVAALIAAAVLVVYLQRVEAASHQQQTVALVEQMCIRALGDASARLRELLDGPYVSSVAVIRQTHLREYNLEAVMPPLVTALTRYPFVEQYFLWSKEMPEDVKDQVLFVGRDQPRDAGAGSKSEMERRQPKVDPRRGRLIFELAKRLSQGRQSYAVVDVTVDGVPSQVVVHLLWASPARAAFHAVIGYIVDLDKGPRLLFEELDRRHLPSLSSPAPFLPDLELGVVGESGRRLHGRSALAGVPAARGTVDGLFFPGPTLGPYLWTRPEPRRWTITVSAKGPVTATSAARYWASGAAVLLIMVAIGCAASVARHASRLSSIQADFVANVSHQLKTPLSKLMGASDTLGLGRIRSPEKIEQYADMVRVQTGRLWELVEEMIAFSRARQEPPQTPEPIDLVQMADAVVADFCRTILDDDTILRLDASSQSAVVIGDPGALRQMLTNLLENAVTYGNGRTNHIVVRVETARKTVVLSVRDEGVGIHPQDLPHIFEKFYRGRVNGTRPPGFGLGLASVQSIVRAHKGHVAVNSQLGQGSEFRISIPAYTKGNW